jgi:hypothetical protein
LLKPLSFVAIVIAAAWPISFETFGAEPTAKTPSSWELKLHGDWVGTAPCQGDLTLNPDGTFERRHFSPGGNRLSGDWQLSTDQLPPTLVLHCKDSDESDRHSVETTTEYQLVELDDNGLSCGIAGTASHVRFARPTATRLSDPDAYIRRQIPSRWMRPERHVFLIDYRPIKGMENRSSWHVKGTRWWVRIYPEVYKLDDLDKSKVYEIDAVALDQNYGVIDFYLHSGPKAMKP